MRPHLRRLRLPARSLAALLSIAACSPSPSTTIKEGDDLATPRLPTGRRLDPAGRSFEVGQMPIGAVATKNPDRLVLSLEGWRQQGVQVVDWRAGRIVQTIVQPAAFMGLAWNADSSTLFASGGNQDLIYRYAWNDTLTLRDSIMLGPPPKRGESGVRYPAGMATSRDGRWLFVAENLADSLAVIDLSVGRIAARVPTGRYPYAVLVANDGTVYVSNWGDYTVSIFEPSANGLSPRGTMEVARHPSALAMSHNGAYLFAASGSTDKVAVVSIARHARIGWLETEVPGGPGEGSTPNALAVSPDDRWLYVAEGDNNAVAVFDLRAAIRATSVAANARKGRVPVQWYPASIIATNDQVVVVNAKGTGSAPNPKGPQPGIPSSRWGQRSYTLDQLYGTVTVLDAAQTRSDLENLTARVARANRWDTRTARPSYPPIEHVLYIIRENRTYDQVFGDLSQADGDTSLNLFPRSVTTNAHALAERFGIYDRFFVNAEVSADGHNWSTSAYASDYVQKTVSSNYSNRGRAYDYSGTNRDELLDKDDDDVNSPSTGYLWDLAARAKIDYRDYGEFTVRAQDLARSAENAAAGSIPTKKTLSGHTSPSYMGYDLTVTDQSRADAFLAEFAQYSREGKWPVLMIMSLPNDHTSGATAGRRTPRAYVADNDLALGRIVDAISHSPFWKNTVIFVLEDDAQAGPDHVDSHRSPLLVISPWSKGGVHHRYATTSDVIATIEELLHLGTLSQFDTYGRPLREIWRTEPDVQPYVALTPPQSITETNPPAGRAARESATLNLAKVDAADMDRFNRVIWMAVKGEHVPYPAPRRLTPMSALGAR